MLASNSSNLFFIDQLKATGNVSLNFNSSILPHSIYFLSNDNYHELCGYLKDPTGLIPFVSSPDNPRLGTEITVFINAYKDFNNNQVRIYELEIRLLNSVIIGSVADWALMSETMRVYDFFKATNFYIQSDQPYYYWTVPIMVEGSYQDFLDYEAEATDDYPPIIINNSYASHNKIKIHDLFNIYNHKYRVLGFATSVYVNGVANETSFIYNPYLWIRGDEYNDLLKNITDALRLIANQISINAALATAELNPGFWKHKTVEVTLLMFIVMLLLDIINKPYTPLNHMKELIY